MGISKNEAARRLAAGDLAFIADADPSDMGDLVRLSPQAPFYAALRFRSAGDAERAEALLRAALGASDTVRRHAMTLLVPPLIRAGRAEEALDLLRKTDSADADLREREAETLYALGRYRESFTLASSLEEPARTGKVRALALSAELRIGLEGGAPAAAAGKKVLAYLLGEPSTPNHRWVFEELTGIQGFSLDAWAEKAILGRLSVLERSYGEALRRLETAVADNREAFFGYPELISDLGKAYQYGGKEKEGAERFTAWADEEGVNDSLRFRLLFYAGRMQRQWGDNESAYRSFHRALPFAPDPIQRDAAVWYLLDTALARSPAEAVPLIRKYAPVWHDPSFFTDFLDKLCGALIAGGKWPELLETFRVVGPSADGATVARYAYVIGRAVSEGYIGVGRPIELLDRLDIRNAPPPTSKTDTAKLFFRMAYQADNASYYYRSLSAAILGETISPAPASSAPLPEAKGAEELEFFLDFYEYGCADLIMPFVQASAQHLEADVLRRIAAAAARAERWGDSIRIAGLIGRKNDHRYTLEDLKLLYPRPFPEIADAMADRYGIPKELFYGLLRTESAFIPDVVSRSGAVGLAQLMPATARDVAGRIARQGGPDYLKDGGPALKDPETNLHLGAWYLEYLIERMGSPMTALASYNGGMTRVRNWRNARPELPEDLFLETIEITETRDYGRKVLAAATVYGYLYFGMTMEAVVADIFPKAGGSVHSVPNY